MVLYGLCIKSDSVDHFEAINSGNPELTFDPVRSGNDYSHYSLNLARSWTELLCWWV